MTEDLFKKLKIAINNEKVLCALKKSMLTEAKELETNELIGRYLELCGITTATNFIKVPDEKNIDIEVFNSFLKNIKPNETNKIFIYAGTYKYGENGMIKIKASSVDREYRKYFDMEQAEPFFLPIEESIQFEKENIIIVASVDDVRRDFLKESIESNQEKGLVLIKNKYKTKINN